MTVEATFLITCLDEENKVACERIKGIMHDCEVADSHPNAAQNHTGTREFETTDDALARMREIERLAGKDAISVRVRVCYGSKNQGLGQKLLRWLRSERGAHARG